MPVLTRSIFARIRLENWQGFELAATNTQFPPVLKKHKQLDRAANLFPLTTKIQLLWNQV